MSIRKYAIIVAGGSGVRMGYDVPKQFIPLAGVPILMHTINIFEALSFKPEIILVLPENQIGTWKELCDRFGYKVKHQIITGGDTRFQSVKNGLSLVQNEGIIAIHDGVRPLVSKTVIEECYRTAEELGSAVPVVKPVESVRLTETSGSYPFDRDRVLLVQTPQVFKSTIIKRCYETPWQPSFTDDASVVEFCGEKVSLVEGNRENIKITTPHDLLIAEAIIKNNDAKL